MAKVLTFTACAAAVGVALYAAAGYVGVPYAVRTVIEKNVSELLNRTVTLDDVRFNPWTWIFELRGLTIPEEGSDPLLSLGLLRIDASSQTLFKLAPVLDEITIDGLKVNAVVNEKIAENLRNSSAEMTPTRQLKQLRNPQIHLTPVFLSSRSTTSPLRTALCATKTNHRALMSHSLTYR